MKRIHRAKSLSLWLCIAGLLSLLLLLFPWSLSTQTSSFSLSLDLDSSEGDQAISSLDVFPNRTIPIQIFGTDIQGASNLFLRFEFDPTQVAYEGFKRSNIVSGTSSLPGKDFANIGITLSTGNAHSGLIGTAHFRTTEAFSGTDIRLVHARLVREGQTETVSLDLNITLLLAKPPSPDFDRSGTVGIPDFLLFVDSFGSRKGQDKYEAKYDLDVNGEIGIPDFLIFVDSFGKVLNRAPIFTSVSVDPTSMSSVMLSVDENTPSGQPIGDPISASDADGDTLTYRLSGADADRFTIDANTGQIQAKETYNFEQQDTYSVIVYVSDGEGGETGLAVSITSQDIDEPPMQPAPPRVTAIAPTSLTLTWEEPVNTGPEITDYDVQYRQADSDEFIDAEYDGTERSVRLTGLLSSTRHEIQVRAHNEEGTSEWSMSGEGTTSAPPLPPPSGSGEGGGTSPPPQTPPTPSQPEENVETVEIPDAGLAGKIRETLGLTNNAPIPLKSLARLTRLSSPKQGITDLTGLEHAISLDFLKLSVNSISDISAVENLTNLRSLILTVNSISDISPLSNLTNLRSLFLDVNSISDISPLSNLTNLKLLMLESNSISDISPIANLTNLQDLFLAGNSISDISAVENLTNVTLFTLNENSVSDISPIANWTKPTWLDLANNQISDLSPLTTVTSVKNLFLENNRISDISPIANLTNLKLLHLDNNDIVDVSPLSDLTRLEKLKLYGNNISNPCELYSLQEGGTEITGVTVSGPCN